MKKIIEYKTIEYKYNNIEEREDHVRRMKSDGYICTGQIKKSDDDIFKENREFYYYAKFILIK